MSSFVTDRSLLNPKFEGYRLHALSEQSHILRYPLPSDHKPTQTGVSGRTFLSFQEVQSRINHNHLAVKYDRAIFVDGESNVVLVELDSSTLRPTLRTIYSLPQSIHTSSSDQLAREYPSVVCSSPSTCFAADGQGYLHILQLPEEGGTGEAELLGSYELEIPAQYSSSVKTCPFKIHNASEVSPNIIVCILSSRYRPIPPELKDSEARSASAHPRTQVEFDVWAARFTFPHARSDAVKPLDIIWHRRGEDVPILASYDASRQAFFLLGSSQYRDFPSETPAPAASEPSQLATQPNNDVQMFDSTPKPTAPPYSWTQMPDTISLAFPLPTSTSTSAIKVAFSPRSLSILTPSIRYAAKTLWGPINPTQSLWTFDREADVRGEWGLLTVHLDKRDVGTRWPQVFQEDGVPETLDPSELAGILEAMEKFTTTAEETQKDQSQDSLGRGVPSLARDEYDEEVDESVGRVGRVTWVDARGDADGDAAWAEPEWWAKRGKDREEVVGLLSTPLPGLEGEASLIVKEHLDGVVFTLPSRCSNEAQWKWANTGTFPALSFVLASKRDTRFTYHTNSQPKLVMAFESGSQTFGGNVYLYREPTDKEKWGVQSVLKVGGGQAGAVLGVGTVRVGPRKVVVCLCEGEIVVLKDVL
ncbi:hypothetical protein NEOLEDRAFT_1234336 [Neolentinus lepideus HHB14362 ss-1]|uniref:NudC domain-containing protein 1 n=1 Tax=Neolentinus lepideus HHB14362 ss-1 TaxID=1314782 RepID=A0A165NC47_9AGAM|nr:hypothetical protein NEOLEDRAFT_1234336 [Neolentinus lepideus HHB14362 ss-1]